jgi:hypothetical protein
MATKSKHKKPKTKKDDVLDGGSPIIIGGGGGGVDVKIKYVYIKFNPSVYVAVIGAPPGRVRFSAREDVGLLQLRTGSGISDLTGMIQDGDSSIETTKKGAGVTIISEPLGVEFDPLQFEQMGPDPGSYLCNEADLKSLKLKGGDIVKGKDEWTILWSGPESKAKPKSKKPNRNKKR